MLHNLSNLSTQVITRASNCEQIVLHLRASPSSPSFFLSKSSISSVLPPTDLCELQVTVRNKTVFGSDKVVGVSVIPLGRALRASNYTLDLGYSIPLTKMGRALLTVLSQRPNDETAKDFFALKTQRRTADE